MKPALLYIENVGTIEYIDCHYAGFHFIGYRDCKVPCNLASIQFPTSQKGSNNT